MPLVMMNKGEDNIIKRIIGNNDVKRFLESLGFVIGAKVTIISKIQDNLIVNIKDSRVAIGKDMANKIIV